MVVFRGVFCFWMGLVLDTCLVVYYGFDISYFLLLLLDLGLNVYVVWIYVF